MKKEVNNMSSKKILIVRYLKVLLISLIAVTFFMAFGSSCSPEKGDRDTIAVYDDKDNYMGKKERVYDGEKWVDTGIMDYNNTGSIHEEIDESGHKTSTFTSIDKKYKWDKKKEEWVLIKNTKTITTYTEEFSIDEIYKWDKKKEEYVYFKTTKDSIDGKVTAYKKEPATKKERKPTHMINLQRNHSFTEPATKDEIKDTKKGTSKAENTGGNTGGGGGAGGGGGHGGQP